MTAKRRLAPRPGRSFGARPTTWKSPVASIAHRLCPAVKQKGWENVARPTKCNSPPARLQSFLSAVRARSFCANQEASIVFDHPR